MYRSAQVLEMFTGTLKRLRAAADSHAARFRSEGFTRFFATPSAARLALTARWARPVQSVRARP